MISDELKYRLLKLPENDPKLSQPAISRKMGISLSKANYCLRTLIDRGIIKARNSNHNQKKTVRACFLTPEGLEEKANITFQFLQAKLLEYERLKTEIDEIRKEASVLGDKTNARNV